jgi:hypothetical protein
LKQINDFGDQANMRRLLVAALWQCRPVWIGLSIAAYLIWFFSLLPHPLDSRWLSLAYRLPNAMLLNVLGFEAFINAQYQLYGESMPWLGGWCYLAPAVVVGLLIPITAGGLVWLTEHGTRARGIQSLLLAIPFTLLGMATCCTVLNMLDASCWQSFVQNREPLVYQGIIVYNTSTLYPLLIMGLLMAIITLVLRYTGMGQRLMASPRRWQILLLYIMLQVWLVCVLGIHLTGKQPPIFNRDGGYHSAAFLLIATALWLALYQSTWLIVRYHSRLAGSRTTTPTTSRWHCAAVSMVCLGLCGWLIYMVMVFSDLPDQRWCQITFHRAAELSWLVQLVAAGSLLVISFTGYRWLQRRTADI